jgi:hypothetical protein
LQDWLKRHGLVLAIVAVVIALTDAYYLGDTADYVGSVLTNATNPQGARWNPLWEFGHLLWRPLGLILLKVLHSVSSDGFGLPPHLLLTRAFIAVNILCGVGVAVLTHSLALSVTRSRLIAACVAIAFLVSNGVLNYTQTGNAYITGLFFVTLGVWVIRQGIDSGRFSTGAAIAGGSAVAVSALFWFPFAFVAPAAAAMPFIWQRSLNASRNAVIGFVLQILVAAGLVLLLVYGAVVLHLGIHSVADLKEWVLSAGHGVKPGLATNSMRLVFGIPRSFIELGDDGKLIKRYLLRDPYAETTLVDVVRTAAPPLLLFYSTLAALVWAAAKSAEGRRVLWVCAAAAIPVIFFAVVVFEAGSMERYFPVYPFLALLVACGLQNTSWRNPHRYLAAILFAVIVVRSGLAMSHSRAEQRQQAQATRITPVRQDAARSDVLVLLNYQDELMHFVKTFPFHPSNRPSPVPIFCVFEPGNARMNVWREDFAARVIKAWNDGGTVWVSKRFITERPSPEWNWVEGDDRRISWAGSREFFRQFEYNRDSGGADGFVALQRSEANRNHLLPLIASR